MCPPLRRRLVQGACFCSRLFTTGSWVLVCLYLLPRICFKCPCTQSRVVSCTQSRVVPCPQSRVVPCPQSRVASCPQSRVVSCTQSRVVPCTQSRVASCTQSRVVPCPQSHVASCPQSRVVSHSFFVFVAGGEGCPDAGTAALLYRSQVPACAGVTVCGYVITLCA